MARLRAILLSTHPGPAVAVTAITVLLAVADGLEPWRIVVLGIVMALNQASVGLSNDWIDADRDRAVARTDKPVARGDLAPELARNVAVGAALASIGLSFVLGWPAAVAHLVHLGGGWAYNAGLKRTPLSVVPYVAAFGVLPSLPPLTSAHPEFAPLWITAAGALLGVAAHFANVLPDLDDDVRTGVRGLPHRIGRVGSLVLTWVALPAAALSLAAGIGFATPAGIAGTGLALVIAVVGLVLGLRRTTTRVLFRLVIVAALVDVAMLVISSIG